MNSHNIFKMLRKEGEALLEQQMWCWGCDVRRNRGNLLLEYGFEQHPSPIPRYHSAYRYTLNCGCVVTLWGWGLWIAGAKHGSTFISRSRFRVSYTPCVELRPKVWWVDDLPPTESASHIQERHHALTLLATSLRWISYYERWVLAQSGLDYRERTVCGWKHRRKYRGGIPPSEMALKWHSLSTLVESARDYVGKTQDHTEENTVWEQPPLLA
jgi:hypothetical protein